MTFLEKHGGKLLLAGATLAAIGLIIACVVPGSPVLPFLLGAGVLGSVASAALGTQVFVVACMGFAATLFAGLSLNGIRMGLSRAFNWLVECCIPATPALENYESLLDSEEIKPQEEEGFWAKHWGKVLLGTAVVFGVVAACIFAPYVAPFLGVGIALATPFVQGLVVGLIAFGAATVAQLSLLGIVSGLVEGIKTLCCCRSEQTKYSLVTASDVEHPAVSEKPPLTWTKIQPTNTAYGSLYSAHPGANSHSDKFQQGTFIPPYPN